MKNNILVFAFACLATPVFAQFHLGLSAGPNYSFWNWHIKSLNYDLEYEPAMGWRAGVLGEYQISPLIGVRAAFETQVKANKSEIMGIPLVGYEEIEGVFREKFQYLESSLLIQVSPVKKFRQFYLLAGCTGGRLIKAWSHLKLSEGGETLPSRRNYNLGQEHWNRNAFAADMGLGMNMPLSKTSTLKVEARYQHSLSNLSKHENVDASVHSCFLNVGYLHRL